MSDNWLRYVPVDPYFQPLPDSAAAAEAMLRQFLPQAEAVSSRFHATVTFVDPGANWSGVECPACGTDAEPWFGDALSAAAESGFATLDLTAPCCGTAVSLNDLRYPWPAAFGRYVLEAMNPGVAALTPDQLARLGAVVGRALREIPVHL
jgi:hypothetical protein